MSRVCHSIVFRVFTWLARLAGCFGGQLAATIHLFKANVCHHDLRASNLPNVRVSDGMAIALKLKERRIVAEGTMAFHFQKPPGFAYVAGQAGDWILQHSVLFVFVGF